MIQINEEKEHYSCCHCGFAITGARFMTRYTIHDRANYITSTTYEGGLCLECLISMLQQPTMITIHEYHG